MRKATLYICYYTVTEPLVQTQVIPYLVELTQRGMDVRLLSFEPRGISPQKLAQSGQALQGCGIAWHHLRYHSRPSLLAALYDIGVGTITAAWLCVTHNIRIIHARSHVPAAVGLILKRMLGIRLIFDMRGLLADEYVDAGRWSNDSVKFRLTKRMEAASLDRADALVMLTRRIKEELTATRPHLRNRTRDIEVIPCCIDAKKFAIPQRDRQAYRRLRGWSGRRVLVYAGKLGGWYLTQEMIDFFAAVHRVDDRYFLQVLTQGDQEMIGALLIAAGLPHEDFDVRCVSPDDLPLILAACDAGVSFIKPSYSKIASSPTKVGEYLGAGLPVITNSGIGDCDDMFRDPRLGVVISEFTRAEYRRAALRLSQMLEDPSGADYRRCYALAKLSIQNVGGPRYAAVYDRLLGLAVRVPGVSTPAES
jgi:glycosyltransferase involved in cell wall biosynthesis